MTRSNDFTKYVTDFMGSMPVDNAAMQEAFRTQAQFAEKLSRIALGAAEQSAEIGHKWTRETLSKMAPVATVKEDASDYAKAMTDFASSYAEVSAENMAAFAEVAKKVQTETMEVLMAAGKEAQEDATVAMKKATVQASNAPKRAATAAK
ncbi:Phasin [Jannaschia sp. W003]|uniref:Phasin n=1 Tax=Jannaschia sp. W003 TaxID=2867012 RepID=UPI0021A3AD80|nr:Phasin [Jannaschia sp. W003]UWQ20779.1 Phasin [Jannaschia sp. W003]